MESAESLHWTDELISSLQKQKPKKEVKKSSTNSARELNEFLIKSFNGMRLLGLDFKIAQTAIKTDKNEKQKKKEETELAHLMKKQGRLGQLE